METTLIKTDIYSYDRDESWAKVFKLSDFGRAPSEQFIIKSGLLGLSKSDGTKLSFSIYGIDSAKSLGSIASSKLEKRSRCQEIPYGYSIHKNTKNLLLTKLFYIFDCNKTNVSTDLNPTHTFTASGNYEITATVKSTTGISRFIKRKLEITNLPIAHPIKDIYVCAEENSSYSNWISSFPTSHLEKEVLRDQKNMIVTYY